MYTHGVENFSRYAYTQDRVAMIFTPYVLRSEIRRASNMGACARAHLTADSCAVAIA